MGGAGVESCFIVFVWCWYFGVWSEVGDVHHSYFRCCWGERDWSGGGWGMRGELREGGLLYMVYTSRVGHAFA